MKRDNWIQRLDHRLANRGIIFNSRENQDTCFVFPKRLDRLCGAHSLLPNGYRRLKRQERECVLFLRLRMTGIISPLHHTPLWLTYRDYDTFTIYETEVATNNLNHTVKRTQTHSCELGSVRELQIHKTVTLVSVTGQMGRLHRFRKYVRRGR